jgi:S1-C subfamily serine protease
VQLISFGSGACVDPSGIVITARHVVEDYINKLPDFEIVFTKKGSKKYEAIAAKPISMVVSQDYDVAVLKLPEIEGGWPYLSFPKAWNTLEGDEVATIGFPLRSLNYPSTLPNLFSGIVSKIDEIYTDETGWNQTNLVLDISVHPGNSGGPVFKSHNGEVIGIISNQRLRDLAIQKIDEAQEVPFVAGVWTNITNCVPWTQIKPLVDEMKKKYSV